MSALDDLRAAGFSDQEVGDYAAQQRSTLTSAGFTEDEINQHLGTRTPDTGVANKAFSRVLGDALSKSAAALKPAGETMADVGQVYPAIEAALNAGTGLLFGFPAYVGAGLGGLVSKHLLGLDADPKELAETMQKVFTYQPMTQRGQRLAGNVMMPLTKLSEGAEFAGQRVTDFASKAGASDNTAAALGAVSDATIQMLAPVLLGELGRKMGGQTVTDADMRNTAKVIAGADAPAEAVKATEDSLHATYEQTGIGPFTVLQEAEKSPELRAELADPAVNVPKQFEAFVDKPKVAEAPVPGDGLPVLDVSGPTAHEAAGATGAVTSEMGPLPRLIDANLAGKSFDELDAMYAGAREHNRDVDLEAIRRFWGPEQAAEAESWSTRKRENWLSKNETDEASDWMQERYVNDELIAAHRDAVNDFDTDSPRELGRSVAIRAKDVEEPGFFDTPGGISFVNALRYAKEQGWDLNEVMDGMRSRSAQWAGQDAPELFARLFKKAQEKPEAISQRLAPPAPRELEQGTVEMNAGLNPAASIRAIRDSYTPFVGVESPNAPVRPAAGAVEEGPKHPFFDSLQKIFAPASRGDVAATQAGIMRANFGEMAREREVALEKMKDFAAQFDKMPVEENVKFIDAYEHGTSLADPKLNEAAQALHTLNQSRREAIQALGKGQLENFDENYLGRIWKDDSGRAERDMLARRPLEGSKNMLKHRTIPFYTDGLRWRAYDAEGDFVKSFDTEAQAKAAAGADGRVGAPLTPITTNPIEMALLKVREADKYIYGQRIFAEMKDADLARFVRFGERALPGWTKINDKIARVLQPNEGEGGGMILRGDYYAPDQAATLINNHLSPGFQGNGFYDAWRGVGNAVNSLQLGLSAFHVGFTSMDAMISKAALGVKQISRGDVIEGAANVLQGLNPAQPFVNIYKGDRLLRAYLGELNNPDLMPIVDAIQQAGGRVKMDDFYRNAQVNAFKQALRRAAVARENGDFGQMATANRDAAIMLVPTILDRIGAPIFEWLVPRQKLGVFFDMAKDWLAENPKADVAAKRAGLGKLWDSVDNRMGQLVYDNVFWNRALKDSLMATVRSVGWNLGTFRELGGGVLDIKDIGKNKGLSDRTAYVIALPMITSIYGAVLNYAYTGETPQSLKDAFYPRTGKLRPDGSEDRVSLPTYMKDVFAYGEDAHNFAAYGSDPTQTLKNKMHPLIATISEMLNNKDFFGGAIRNPADKAVEQIADEVKFLIEQFSPFSYRNYIQQAKAKGEEPSVMGYLTSPSMIGITPAPGYIAKSPEELESAHVSQLHDSLVQKFKEQIKGGKNPEDLMAEMLRSGMTKRDIKYIVSTSGDVPKPHKLKKFGSADE